MNETPITHLMIDIETLGKKPDTVVLSIGCVPFTLENHTYFSELVKQGIHIKFDAKEQIKNYHRTVNKDTTDWWKKQSEKSRSITLEPSKNDCDITTGLYNLNKFIETIDYSFKNSYVFSRRSHFDFSILNNIYESAYLSTPWNDWMIRDSVTFIDIFAGTNTGKYDLKLGEKDKGFIPHYALHDAALEAAKLNELYYIAMENPEF